MMLGAQEWPHRAMGSIVVQLKDEMSKIAVKIAGGNVTRKMENVRQVFAVKTEFVVDVVGILIDVSGLLVHADTNIAVSVQRLWESKNLKPSLIESLKWLPKKNDHITL